MAAITTTSRGASMSEPVAFTLDGHAGALAARKWGRGTPRYLALLCHGYGEHSGRYEYVASRLVADGAVVYAMDHVGHGLSDGERVLIDDFERVVEDFRLLDLTARRDDPATPVVLVGHSMGGMIAARYAQRYGSELTAVVLSGPVLGRWAAVDALLAAEEIPDTPIDPSTLSRDPEVGRAYVEDALVWHGPFKRPTVQALKKCLETITEAGPIDSVPVLWLHGEDDRLVPLDGTASGWETLAGPDSSSKIYPQARHEIFNEIDRDRVLDDVVDFVGAQLPRLAAPEEQAPRGERGVDPARDRGADPARD